MLDWKARISIRALPSSDSRSNVEPPSESNLDQTLAQNLCYACYTMLTSRSPRSGAAPPEGVVLPLWASPVAIEPPAVHADEVEGELVNTKVMDRGAMKEAIGDFLLDE